MPFLKVITSDFFSDYAFEVDGHKRYILSTKSTKNTKRHIVLPSSSAHGKLVIVRVEKRLGYRNRVKDNQEEMRG